MNATLHDAMLILQLILSLCMAHNVSSTELSAQPGTVLIETATDTVRLEKTDIAGSPFYLQGHGSFTTSTGTVISGRWGGISLPGILTHLGELRRDDSVVFVASDGYEMTNSGEDILDESDGIWIIAYTRDGTPFSESPISNRTIKVGPTKPNILGHTSVQDVTTIRIDRIDFRDFTLAVSGFRQEHLDRQTIQSCVGCHGVDIPAHIDEQSTQYSGAPLHRFLAYADDPLFIPHAQDMSISSYNGDRAQSGYPVRVYAANGKIMSLDSNMLHKNDGFILGYYRDSHEIPENEAPLVLIGYVAGDDGERLMYLPNVTGIELVIDSDE